MTYTHSIKAAAAVALLSILAVFGSFGSASAQIPVSESSGDTGPRTIHMSFAGGSPSESTVKTLCNTTGSTQAIEAYAQLVGANRSSGFVLKFKELLWDSSLLQRGTWDVVGEGDSAGFISNNTCRQYVFKNSFNGSGVVLATAYDVELGFID